MHSEAWRAVIEYVVLAWKYVSDLPDWDNEDHNKSKRQCFKNLAAQCMTAIKKSAFEKEQYREIKNRSVDGFVVSCVALKEMQYLFIKCIIGNLFYCSCGAHCFFVQTMHMEFRIHIRSILNGHRKLLHGVMRPSWTTCTNMFKTRYRLTSCTHIHIELSKCHGKNLPTW